MHDCVHACSKLGPGCEESASPPQSEGKEEKRVAQGSFLFGNLFCFLNVRVSRWCV